MASSSTSSSSEGDISMTDTMGSGRHSSAVTAYSAGVAYGGSSRGGSHFTRTSRHGSGVYLGSPSARGGGVYRAGSVASVPSPGGSAHGPDNSSSFGGYGDRSNPDGSGTGRSAHLGVSCSVAGHLLPTASLHLSGKFADANDQFAAAMGVAKEQLLNLTIFGVTPQQHMQKLYTMYERMLTGDIDTFHTTRDTVGPGGQVVPVRCSFLMVKKNPSQAHILCVLTPHSGSAPPAP